MSRPAVSFLARFMTSNAFRKNPWPLHFAVSRQYASAPTSAEALQERHVKSTKRLSERVSTASLVRSLILGRILRTPILYNGGLYCLQKIANSRSAWLNADRNHLIRAIVYPLIYRHFCAGRDPAEVRQTIAGIKQMGYSGIILCLTREAKASPDNETIGESEEDGLRRDVKKWAEDVRLTMDIIDEGDYVGIKYTGVGSSVSKDLKAGRPPHVLVQSALHQLCEQARAQHKRIWIDAEQQMYHPAIDDWTIELMRKFNRDGQLVVLTTIQAYLKNSRQTVDRYIRLAKAEGWRLGIKLVRGAYIASDVRSNIHDTLEDTHASYDGIVRDILTKSWPGYDKTTFPAVTLFVAGHNSNSIRKTAILAQQLSEQHLLSEPVQYGQLQGMADEIGCELLAMSERAHSAVVGTAHVDGRLITAAPQPFKCLSWGSLSDCLHYLVRRAVENRGAAERLAVGLQEMRKELRLRLLKF